MALAELEQLTVELERTIDHLAEDTWAREPEWCQARLSEFYDGALTPERAVREAHLWFLLECPLPDGQTPIWRMRQERPERAVELLARSELRSWRIDALPVAICPVTRVRVQLELPVGAAGGVDAGAVAIGRSVPLGPARWMLLGAPSSIEPPAAAAFERLIASLHAPAGEFWRVHGSVLARAALEPPFDARTVSASRAAAEGSRAVSGQ